MSSNNYWLHGQLRTIPGADVDPRPEPVITVRKGKEFLLIYTPSPDEYIVGVDVVQKAAKLGANTVSYPAWARSSIEAESFGRSIGVRVMRHAQTIAIIHAA